MIDVTRLRVVMLLATVALAATACGGGDSGSSSQGSAESGGAAKGSITVWAMGAEGDKLGAVAKEFEAANPDIKVRVTPVSWDVAHDKLLTSIAGGKTPDVSLVGTTWMAEFAETGALAETPDSIDKDAFLPNAWKTVSVDGTDYGVPWYVETRVLYYRTDLAKKAGWTHAPRTWDELKQLAADYKSKAGTAHGIALAPNNWQELIPFAWQAGSTVATPDGAFSLDDEGMVKALTFDKSFFEDGLTPQRVPQGFDVTQGFVNGSDPMFFSGPWHLALIRDQGGAKLNGKWDVALMPKGTDGRTSFLGGGDLAVFENSKNKDAAWKFVEYLSQPDVQAKWFSTVGDLPSVKAAYDNGKLASDPQLKLFRQQLDDASPPPVLPKWEEVASSINDVQEKVTTGGMSPEQGAKEMQQEAESIAA
jgi:multiple sugar transport system substrate-binding protein